MDEASDRLRAKGFRESPDDTVVCRMRLGLLKVDFMPDDPEILGFSNRWYRRAIETAVRVRISDTLTIRRLTPELFVATKLEAYLGRGTGDLLGSRDIEDIILVFDGRPEIVGEIHQADEDVRAFIIEHLDRISGDRNFEMVLAGNIRGPVGRADLVRDRLLAVVADHA